MPEGSKRSETIVLETPIAIIPVADSEDLEGQSTVASFEGEICGQNSTELDAGLDKLEPAQHNIENPADEPVDDKEYEGVNVDDSIQGRTNVDDEFGRGINEGLIDVREARNDNSTEGDFGIVQDQGDIGGTIEVKEGDINVQSDVHKVSLGTVGATIAGELKEEGVHTRVQTEAVIDSYEPEEESVDIKEEDGSYEVVGGSLNDTTEKVVKIEETTEDIGGHPGPGQDLENSSEENQNKVDTEDVALRTIAVNEGNQGATVSDNDSLKTRDEGEMDQVVTHSDNLTLQTKDAIEANEVAAGCDDVLLKTRDEGEVDQDVAESNNVSLKTEEESEVVKVDEEVLTSSVAPQESKDSVTQARQSESVQERKLYGHIHNIFGKQQGEKCILLNCVS